MVTQPSTCLRLSDNNMAGTITWWRRLQEEFCWNPIMATLPLKSSRNEQRAVILFLWAKGLNANEIHSEIRPVYKTSVLRDQQYTFGVRSLLAAEKALLIRNDLAGMLRRPMP